MKRANIKKKGSVLVFVLALIVFISVLCVRLMKETTQELRHVSQFHRRDDLRTYAYSALDLVVGVVNEYKMALNKLENGQGWQNPLKFAEMENPSFLSNFDGGENESSAIKWSVELSDESGKIPLNKVSDQNLVALFAQMVSESEGGGLTDEEDGRPLLDSLRDWEDEDDDERDDGAEDDFYEDLDSPYFTPGRKISSFDEFKMIKGFGFGESATDELGLFFNQDGTDSKHFKDFKDSFSFYNEGAINPFACSDFILRVLAGSDDFVYEELIELKSSDSLQDRNEFYDSISKLASEMGIKISREVIVLRVVITVERGKSMFQLHAVLSTQLAPARGNVRNTSANLPKVAKRSKKNEKLKYPLRLLALRENENLID